MLDMTNGFTGITETSEGLGPVRNILFKEYVIEGVPVIKGRMTFDWDVTAEELDQISEVIINSPDEGMVMRCILMLGVEIEDEISEGSYSFKAQEIVEYLL